MYSISGDIPDISEISTHLNIHPYRVYIVFPVFGAHVEVQPFFLRREKKYRPGATIATGESSLAKGDEAMDRGGKAQ